MSEQIKNENEPYYGDDRQENPSLYGETKLIHDISTMSDEVLDEKTQRFIAMMNDPETLPAHKAIAAKMIDYIVFETTYRERERQRAIYDLALWEKEG